MRERLQLPFPASARRARTWSATR